MNTNQWHVVNEQGNSEQEIAQWSLWRAEESSWRNWLATQETVSVVTEEECNDCEMVDGRHTYACQTNWVDTDIEEEEEILPEGTWIEDTPTKHDDGELYAQHYGYARAPHHMRWVYSDGTRVRGPRGEWEPCQDCQAEEEAICEQCGMHDGNHSMICRVIRPWLYEVTS